MLMAGEKEGVWGAKPPSRCTNRHKLPVSGVIGVCLTTLEPEQLRVVRGGSWNNTSENLRAAARNRNEPDNRNNNLGFRVCRVLVPPSTLCRQSPCLHGVRERAQKRPGLLMLSTVGDLNGLKTPPRGEVGRPKPVRRLSCGTHGPGQAP